MTQLFYTYSTADARHRDRLEKQLQALKHRGVVTGWQSRAISPGAAWRRETSPHAARADLFLLLMSADLVASGYCDGAEVTAALDRQRRGETRVIPVLIRPCNMKGTPVAGLPVLPRDGKPVTRWSNPDAAFEAIAAGIAAATGATGVSAPAGVTAASTTSAASSATASSAVRPAAATPPPLRRSTNGTPTPAEVALAAEEIGPEFVALDQPKDRDDADAGSASKFVSVARAGSRRVAQLVYRAAGPEDALSRLSTAVHAELAKGARAEPTDPPANSPTPIAIRRVSSLGSATPQVSTFAAKGRFLVAAKVIGERTDPAGLSERIVHRMLNRIPD